MLFLLLLSRIRYRSARLGWSGEQHYLSFEVKDCQSLTIVQSSETNLPVKERWWLLITDQDGNTIAERILERISVPSGTTALAINATTIYLIVKNRLILCGRGEDEHRNIRLGIVDHRSIQVSSRYLFIYQFMGACKKKGWEQKQSVRVHSLTGEHLLTVPTNGRLVLAYDNFFFALDEEEFIHKYVDTLF